MQTPPAKTVTRPEVPVSAPTPAYAPDGMPVVGVGAGLFVWGVWALTLGSLLAYVAQNSNNVPWSDDFVFLEGMMSPWPSRAWLLAPHNHHFVAFPRFVVYVLGKLTNYDFRAGMYVSLLALGGVAAGLIWAARSVRGCTRYTDAIFPLAILSFGHMENFLQNWGAVVYTIAVTLAGLVLILVARCHGRPTLWQALGCGACVILLPLSGGQGLAFAVPPLLWLGVVATSWWRSGLPGGRRNAMVIGSLVLLSVLACALALYCLKQASDLPARPSLRHVLRGVFEQLSLMFGSAVISMWHFEVGVLASLLLTLGLAFLVWKYVRQPGDRFRSAGFAAVLGGLVAIALATAVGRSQCLQQRYAIFMVLIPCTLYLVGVVQDRSAVARLCQAGLFVAVCLLLTDSSKEGLSWGKWTHEELSSVEHDVRRGVPGEILVPRYLVQRLGMINVPAAQVGGVAEKYVNVLRQLRDKRSGIFVDLQDMPTNYQEVTISSEPATFNEVVYHGGMAYGVGADSYLSYALDRPRMVYAVRLKGVVQHLHTELEKFMVGWGEGTGGAPEGQETLYVRGKLIWLEQPREEDFVVDAWVNDTIDSFRVRPDEKPWKVRISEIVLLVPSGS